MQCSGQAGEMLFMDSVESRIGGSRGSPGSTREGCLTMMEWSPEKLPEGGP